MRFQALHRFTGQLPLVKPSLHPERTGRDTHASIVSGVQQGMLDEMEGAIRAYRRRHPALNAVLTGGDWVYFANRLKNPIFVAPALTLLGLHEILTFNGSRG
jgi:type III pantothenate kinase